MIETVALLILDNFKLSMKSAKVKKEFEVPDAKKIKVKLEDQKEDEIPLKPFEYLNDISLANSSTKVWLVKVPNFVAEAWSKIENENTEIGCIRKPETGPMSLHLPSVPWAAEIPRDYNLAFTKMPSNMNEYLFSEDKDGLVSEISGIITNEATVSPVYNEAYRKMMQKRKTVLEQNVKSIRVEEGNDNWIPRYRRETVGFINKKTVSQNDRKERLPKNELHQLLFSLFAKETSMSFKDIAIKTKQPQGYLKEVLAELAVLNKKGTNSNNYELKPEYAQANVTEKDPFEDDEDDLDDEDEDSDLPE
ncbi:hypothetical protein HK096_004913 [Nowakowskiella sp. JEL0078]|nr:hypothetical protein HK096_004913 [Nowakowskiella sp. JEL0078]